MCLKNTISILGLFLFVINTNSYSQSQLFKIDNGILIYIHGKGLFLNKITETSKITSVPNWLYYPVLDNDGNLWASGFDGVKYVGLIKYSPSGINCYDLTLMGLPSNFINSIAINKNKIALLVFNNVYESELNMVFFNKIDITTNAHISDIKYSDDRLIVLSENELIIKSKSYTNSATVNCKNNCKIISTFNNRIVISTKDSIFQFVENIKSIIAKNPVKIPEFLYDLTSFNYYQNNDLIIFFTPKGAISFYKGNFFLFKDLKCTDMVLQDFETIMLYEDYLLNSPTTNLNSARLLDFKEGKYFLYVNESKQIELRLVDNIYSNSSYLLSQAGRQKKLDTIPFNKLPVTHSISISYESTNLLINISIGFISTLFFSFNYFSVRKKMYYLLPSSLLPILYIFILPLTQIHELISLRYMPVVVWFSSFALFVVINKIDSTDIIKNGSFIISLHEFSHGSIGVNNLVRLNMFIKERKRNAAEFSFFDKTIAGIMQQYYTYTLPSFRKLIAILPFKWSLSYNQFSIYFLILSINVFLMLYSLKVKQKYFLEKIIQYSASFIENFEKTKWKYYSLVKTNVSNVLNEIIQHRKNELLENRIQLIKNNFEDYLPSVIIPQNKLYTIIDNILSNAIEALQNSKIANPKIEITIPKSNLLNLTILVSNNGKKIESDFAAQIFQPVTTTKEHGGFGLYEAKQIANSFLGDVKLVESNEFNTTFSITLRTYYNA